MEPSKACMATPAHVSFLKNRRILPVVVGKKRFNDIMGRSRMEKKLAAAAQAQEDLRYTQYLKDGSDWLCRRFTNVGSKTGEEERQEKLAQEVKDAEIRSRQTKIDDDMFRKNRILRAQRILNELKPGQQALRHAMLESDMIYQRRYNEAINRDIQEDARRQRAIDEEMCPEILIPLSNMEEEERKAKAEAKKVMRRTDTLRAIKENREKKLAADEQEICDIRIDRAQFQCLYEKEQKEAKRRKQQKIDFCRRAYEDGLKEKAAMRKYEQIRNDIENRINCVDVTKRRVLGKQYNNELNAIIGKRIKDREDRAIELCRQQQAKKREADHHQEKLEEQYNANCDRKEACRQAHRARLSIERRAYEEEDRKRATERRQSEEEIRRFYIAQRIKNIDTNTRFYMLQKQGRNEKKANLKSCLNKEREEFSRRRDEEKMNLCACVPDQYISDDVAFFKDARKATVSAKKTGRPLLPFAKAVEKYKRSNEIKMLPEQRLVGRSQLRDYCWPGYYSKAEMAYKNYAARHECRDAEQESRAQILKDYITIKEMAVEEQPYKKCEMECPYKCYQHRGLPAIEPVDSKLCQSFRFSQGSENTCDESGQGTKGKALIKAPLKKNPSAVLSAGQLELKDEPKCSQTN